MTSATTPSDKPVIVGIGLNKTATKSLRVQLNRWGYPPCLEYSDAYQAYKRGDVDAALAIMEKDYTVFEDWPWPLMYREIDERFPNARFILTVRRSPDVWYRSLCKMAVRIGPLAEYEKYIYGSSMPHGRKQHHIEFYNAHNDEVRAYFADRPGKLLELCISQEETTDRLAEHIGHTPTGKPFPEVNISDDVYAGENLAIAHLARLRYQWGKKIRDRFSDR